VLLKSIQTTVPYLFQASSEGSPPNQAHYVLLQYQKSYVYADHTAWLQKEVDPISETLLPYYLDSIQFIGTPRYSSHEEHAVFYHAAILSPS